MVDFGKQRCDTWLLKKTFRQFVSTESQVSEGEREVGEVCAPFLALSIGRILV